MFIRSTDMDMMERWHNTQSPILLSVISISTYASCRVNCQNIHLIYLIVALQLKLQQQLQQQITDMEKPHTKRGRRLSPSMRMTIPQPVTSSPLPQLLPIWQQDQLHWSWSLLEQQMINASVHTLGTVPSTLQRSWGWFATAVCC
jgi:hypothetical protein